MAIHASTPTYIHTLPQPSEARAIQAPIPTHIPTQTHLEGDEAELEEVKGLVDDAGAALAQAPQQHQAVPHGHAEAGEGAVGGGEAAVGGVGGGVVEGGREGLLVMVLVVGEGRVAAAAVAAVAVPAVGQGAGERLRLRLVLVADADAQAVADGGTPRQLLLLARAGGGREERAQGAAPIPELVLY